MELPSKRCYHRFCMAYIIGWFERLCTPCLAGNLLVAVNNTNRKHRHRQLCAFSNRQNLTVYTQLAVSNSPRRKQVHPSPPKSLFNEASPGIGRCDTFHIHTANFAQETPLCGARGPSGGVKFERRTNLVPISVGSPPELSPNAAKRCQTHEHPKLWQSSLWLSKGSPAVG